MAYKRKLQQEIRTQLVDEYRTSDCEIHETTSWPDGLNEASRFLPYLPRPVRRTDSVDDIEKYKLYFSIARKNQRNQLTWNEYCDILLDDLQNSDIIGALNKDYDLRMKKLLGAGGYASVFKAEKFGDDGVKFVAVKVIDKAKLSKDERDIYLLRELTIWQKMRNKNIVELYEILYIEDHVFSIMEYFERGTVSDYIYQYGPVHDCLGIKWIRNVASALNYMHKKDICHRDIKPENILLTSNLTAKLADFGFSKFVTDKYDQDIFCRSFCGTDLFIPPEVIQGKTYDGIQADSWSFGITIFVIFTNEFPFPQNRSVKKFAEKNEYFKFKTEMKRTLNKNLQILIIELLSVIPSERPSMESVLARAFIKKNKRNN